MKKSPLLVIFLIVFFDLVGFGIVIPILPYYTKHFGANAFALGWIMAIYSMMQFLFAPVWGSLSDKYGRRPILLFSMLGAAMSMYFLAMANSLLMIFAARLLAGLFGANISTATAYITDNTTEENRAKGMGLIGAAFGLGFMFGPAIGGVLAKNGYAYPIYVTAIMGLINFVLALVILKENKMSVEERQKNRRKFSMSTFKRIFAEASTRTPISVFFLYTFAFTFLEVSFALFALARFGYDAYQAGLLLGMMGFVAVMIQGGAIGRFTKKWGEVKLVFSGLLFMVLALIGAGFAESPSLFAFALVWIALGQALLTPCLSSLMSKAAPESERGLMLGCYHSAGSLARIFGPPLAGLFFDRIGIASPLFAASAVLLIAFVVAVSYYRQRNIQIVAAS